MILSLVVLAVPVIVVVLGCANEYVLIVGIVPSVQFVGVKENVVFIKIVVILYVKNIL